MYSLLLWLLTATVTLITGSVLTKWSWIRSYHSGYFPRWTCDPTCLGIFSISQTSLSRFAKVAIKLLFFFFLTKPSIKSSFNAVVVNLLGLEDRNPVGGWLSYLFTLMVIIQPSLTHFCLFIFPSHAYLVKFLKRQTCHWSDQTEHLAFFSHTHAFKVLFHFSPAFSV